MRSAGSKRPIGNPDPLPAVAAAASVASVAEQSVIGLGLRPRILIVSPSTTLAVMIPRQQHTCPDGEGQSWQGRGPASVVDPTPCAPAFHPDAATCSKFSTSGTRSAGAYSRRYKLPDFKEAPAFVFNSGTPHLGGTCIIAQSSLQTAEVNR
jgi:hypothetical protein